MTKEFAEICGIHAGDGHLHGKKNTLEICGGYEEQRYYDEGVIPLLTNYFGIELNGRKFPTKGTYGIQKTDKLFKNILMSAGFPAGSKSKIVCVPPLILHSESIKIKRSFLRGYFDTDGCLSFGKKLRNTNPFKHKFHFYPRLSMSTVSKNLMIGVRMLLEQEGYKGYFYECQPKKETESLKYVVQISGVRSTERWMEEIQPRNHTKVSRYEVWKKFGFCPPNTTYSDRLKMLSADLDPYSFYGPIA